MPQTSSAWDPNTDPTEAKRRGVGVRLVARLRALAVDFEGGRRVVVRARLFPTGVGGRRVLDADRPGGRVPAARLFVVTTMPTTVTAVPTPPEDRERDPFRR
jgi:hypothetical protein